jgi:hypothetical protein
MQEPSKDAEPSNEIDGSGCVNPDDLRREAADAERMAHIVSYKQDKQWLTAKAAELRRLAERMEARSDQTFTSYRR